jgi:hypothetical protein
MQAQIAVALGKMLLNYLKNHPDSIDAFARELAKRIPGKTDDKVIAFLAAFFRNLT